MGTTTEKLQAILDSKADIKDAIEQKGVTVGSTPLSGYAQKILDIPSGGGGQDLIDVIEGDITTLSIPQGTTKIRKYGFQRCDSLTSVTIPDSVTSIGESAFYRCTSLTSVTIEAITPPKLVSYTAFSNTNNCPIYVPAQSVEAYKAASGWNSHASRIQAIPTT